MINCIQNKKNNQYKVIIFQTIIYALFLLNCIKIVSVPSSLILLIALISPVFMKKEEIPAYIVGFSMMGTGIQVAYISLMCFVCLLAKNKWKINRIQVGVLIWFCLYEVFHIIFYSNDSYIEFVRYVSVYALFFFVLLTIRTSEENRLIVNSYIGATVFTGLHVLLETLSILEWNFSKIISGTLRLGYAEQLSQKLTFSADPNLLGQSCTFSIVLCLTLLLMGYKEKKYIFATVFCVMIGALTLSKTFLISLVIIMVIVLISRNKNTTIGKQIAIKGGIILLAGIAVYMVQRLYPSYLDNLLNRVDADDITTGRMNNAMIYLSYLSNNIIHLLFGVGMQNVGPKIGFTGSPHAALIEALMSWGIFGATIVITVIVYSIMRNRKYNKHPSFIAYIPLTIFAVIVQSTQLFRLRDRVFGIVAVTAMVGINMMREKK